MDSFLLFWQHLPEKLRPELFQIGSFQVRYYSLMYLLAFFLTYVLVMYRVEKEHYPFSKETIQDLLLWDIFGLIVGARLGYVFFYNFNYYLSHPLEINSAFPIRRRYPVCRNKRDVLPWGRAWFASCHIFLLPKEENPFLENCRVVFSGGAIGIYFRTDR
jgi:hypothetical protein